MDSLRRLCEHRLRRRLLAVDAPWVGLGLLLTEPTYGGLRPRVRTEHFPITSTFAAWRGRA